MNPKKYTINFLLEMKCKNCQDHSFCKLQTYYNLIENPTSLDIKRLNECIFYKKRLVLTKQTKLIS